MGVRLSLIASAASALSILAPARSQDASPADIDQGIFSFGAFGTLGVVHSDEPNADFVRSIVVPRGAGASADWATDVDSLLGAQVSAALGSRLSAVVQVIAEHNYDNTFRPHVEWANLNYAINPALNVRVGRTALPVFAHTEARKVGFSLPWVRTPLELYELVPVTSNDGGDMIWHSTFGRVDNALQVAFGTSDTRYEIADGTEYSARSREQFTVADTVDIGDFSLRGNYGQAHISVDAVQPLFDAFRQFGPRGNAIADRFEAQGSLTRFYGASVNYDPGAWFAMAEFGALDSSTHIGDRHGWYVTGGLRRGPFTPYVTYGEVQLDSPWADSGLDTNALPAPAVPLALQLNAALNQVLAAPPQQSTASLGVRWDVLRNAAIKVQFDHIDLAAGSIGSLVKPRPGFIRGGDVNVFSLTVDFVL
jgi:hypothetical protein